MGLPWSIVCVDRRVGDLRAAGKWPPAMGEEMARTQEPHESDRAAPRFDRLNHQTDFWHLGLEEGRKPDPTLRSPSIRLFS